MFEEMRWGPILIFLSKKKFFFCQRSKKKLRSNINHETWGPILDWIYMVQPINHFERTEAKRDHRSYPSDEDAVRIYRATLLLDQRGMNTEHTKHKNK